MKIYTNTAIDKLTDSYLAKGGSVDILDEGSLNYGLVICSGEGLKFCVIREKYLSPWSSGSVARFYRKLPAKYEKLLNK